MDRRKIRTKNPAWPLWRGGRYIEVAVSGGPTVIMFSQKLAGITLIASKDNRVDDPK